MTGKPLRFRLYKPANGEDEFVTRAERLVLLLCSLLLLPNVTALMEEDQQFQSAHEGVDFPVGWTDFMGGPFSSPDVRMLYPAMVAGEDKDMAGNGPFSWLIFIGDSGESIDDYMLLTEPLVQRGFIVLVTTPMDDETDVEETLEWFTELAEVMVQQNQTKLHVLGSAGNIDLSHWGVGGHGKGAAAAYGAYPLWELSPRSGDLQPPRALFGVGLDLTDFSENFDWNQLTSETAFPRPNTGFFITGTVDEVAPSQEMMERVQQTGGIAWHWMHLLGADHYQFQDSTSFFENDGTPTMSQSAQIEVSSDHLVAYLDTVLHGEHERFRDAFNREQGPRTIGDGNAYVDEDLERSHFLVLTNLTSSHNLSIPLNGSQTLVLSTNWTLRNGDVFGELNASWDVDVTCGWEGHSWQANGSLDSNGTASCSYSMAPVSPGVHKAWLRVSVEGAPSTTGVVVERTNTPMELLFPQPGIYVPQHSSSSITISEVATDPDGQQVRVISAMLTGDDANHFSVELSADGTSLTVAHALDEEWQGECMLEVELRSDGAVLDERNTSLRVYLTPVDDPVEQFGTVPIQQLIEDGQSVAYDLGEVVSDPEGEQLSILIDDMNTGTQGPILYFIEGDLITLTPLENANGATVLTAMVSDGVNPSIELEIPVVVEARDDPVVVNTSEWSDYTVEEDAAFTLLLSQLAYDVDGDVLQWSLEHNHSQLQVTQTNDSFMFTPAPDFNGQFDDLWLNVTDGTSVYDHQFSLIVTPLGDMPVASIQTIQRVSGGNSATMQWSMIDIDGILNTSGILTIDGVLIPTDHSCLIESLTTAQCVTIISLPESQTDAMDFKLKLHDDELDRDIIVSYIFDDTQQGGAVTDSNSNEDSASGLLPSVLIGGGLLVLFILVALLVRRRGGDESDLSLAEQDTSDEDEIKPSSGGLLARAERLK